MGRQKEGRQLQNMGREEGRQLQDVGRKALTFNFVLSINYSLVFNKPFFLIISLNFFYQKIQEIVRRKVNDKITRVITIIMGIGK